MGLKLVVMLSVDGVVVVGAWEEGWMEREDDRGEER